MSLNRNQIEAAIRRTGAQFLGEETTAGGTGALVFEAEGIRLVALMSLEERGRYGALKFWAGFEGNYDAHLANEVNKRLAVAKAVAMDDGALVITFDMLLHGLSEIAVTKSASLYVLDILSQLQSA